MFGSTSTYTGLGHATRVGGVDSALSSATVSTSSSRGGRHTRPGLWSLRPVLKDRYGVEFVNYGMRMWGGQNSDSVE
ncbi:unnamed protein product, partial [Amoebophrya sp. A25]|eukprot:GSA25T00001783001.1